MSLPGAGGILLLRRAGGVWGIASSDVEGLGVEEDGYRITAGGERIFADSILGVVVDLPVHPPAPVLLRFWPEMVTGLAVYERTPVVVVDPRHPPAILRMDD